MAKDPALRAHEDWIGLVQPVGLVVSPVALVNAQAITDKNVKVEQDALKRLIDASVEFDRRSGREETPRIESLRDFVTDVLGWQESDLGNDVDAYNVALEDYGETLRVTHVVRTSDTPDAAPLLLIKVLPTGTDYDDSKHYKERLWQASAQARFERILWEHNVPAGILYNGTSLRLVYVPRGETSGHITFPLAAMCEVSNRPMLSALKLLLSPERLWTLPAKQRLPAILEESRKYQNQVSTELAEQVLGALAELLKGFQAADEHARGGLLGEVLRDDPDEVYGGLLSVLLRLVFVLYSEDRGLLPDDDVYREGYSVTRLFERLREDAALNPDTMDLRYGAWGQLVALFRLIHDGGAYKSDNGENVKLPKREGQLFNPDTYAFLEGRRWNVLRQEKAPIPRVSDGVVYRVLERLLLLDGQRLSYRTLDVEQIGSVYEGLMGFRLERADGPSIGVRPHHVVIDVKKLLEQKPAERAKWLKESAACDLAAKAAAAMKDAKSVDDAVTALSSKISPRTPGLLPAGSLYLQPTDERRRSGSHYTPRALTRPIVETALRPIFERLSEEARDARKGPTPDQILDLKVCDPAMGSGAFLVEACRQLGEKLVDAWTRHNEYPDVPPDEAPLLHAMRKVATRCLYGVDKNRFAVELAKLSLWLATLAKDHPFTFVDHTLRCGDSLLGLSRAQIAGFSWEAEPARIYASQWIEDAIQEALIERRTIGSLGDTTDNHEKALALKRAEDDISSVRLIGDAAVAAFFSSTKPKEQKEERDRLLNVVLAWQKDRAGYQPLVDAQLGLRQTQSATSPFHWEIEFPEVFSRNGAGFDVIVGNPPFMGGSRLSTALGESYETCLKATWPSLVGKIDLVVFFFHRAAGLMRSSGTVALIATYRIADGANALVGLRPLTVAPWAIYWAYRDRRWPGLASTRVSQIAFQRRPITKPVVLEGSVVTHIGCDLRASTDLSSAFDLRANADRSFLGAKPDSLGFMLSDKERDQIVAHSPTEAEAIRRYIIGSDITSRPLSDGSRWIVDFTDFDEAEARSRFPLCFSLVSERVKPGRMALKRAAYREHWWQFTEPQRRAHQTARVHNRILGISRVTKHFVWQWIDPQQVISDKIAFVVSQSDAVFGVIQSCFHEYWSLRRSGKLGVTFSYSPTACFRSFPFPIWTPEHEADVGRVAAQLDACRRRISASDAIGLTEIYNRFHDRNSSDDEIEELRQLHGMLDVAVSKAFGWGDLDLRRVWVESVIDNDDDDEFEEPQTEWLFVTQEVEHERLLARLLELNRQRAEEERLLGAEATTKTEAAAGFALEAQAPKAKKPAKKAKAP